MPLIGNRPIPGAWGEFCVTDALVQKIRRLGGRVCLDFRFGAIFTAKVILTVGILKHRMALRSSISDPLRVDSIILGEHSGRIGMTFCPGKIQPSSLTGGWNRDLALDLSAIRDWGAQILVSLLEPHEFLSVRVSTDELSRLTAALGFEWINAPIVDGSIPDASFLVKWRGTVTRLRSTVERGGAVVFCCMGGRGRTGMMAACLLVEIGYAPDAAIAAVRAVRAGTIETRAQEKFVLNYQIWR